jgi:ribonuclease P/MRP protein subunit POP5
VKHLPKHLRQRWRYLAVGIETWPDATFGRRDFQRELWYAAQNLVGDAGSADLDLTVLRFDVAGGDGAAVVRTRRGEESRARAALACLSTVDDRPVGVRVQGVSGTVRACEEKYIHRGGKPPEQRHVAFEDATEPAIVRDGAVDVRTADGYSGATTLDFE